MVLMRRRSIVFETDGSRAAASDLSELGGWKRRHLREYRYQHSLILKCYIAGRSATRKAPDPVGPRTAYALCDFTNKCPISRHREEPLSPQPTAIVLREIFVSP